MIKGEEKERIRRLFKASGAIAVGFAKAGEVPEQVCRQLDNWIEAGENAGMDWMKKHASLRRHTDNILPGAKTVIVCAFSYNPSQAALNCQPLISSYAYGEDYHNLLRELLKNPLTTLEIEYSCKGRICIDSAPIAERYFALKAGIGKRGKNGSVIVPGAGSRVFLTEILTDLVVAPDEESLKKCLECGKCLRACPSGALKENGEIDCRLCISYLTIEHKGEFNDHQKSVVKKIKTLFGCDACIRVCPENKDACVTEIEGLLPLPQTMSLGITESLEMSIEEFRMKFRKSPIKRIKPEGLRRNARLM